MEHKTLYGTITSATIIGTCPKCGSKTYASFNQSDSTEGMSLVFNCQQWPDAVCRAKYTVEAEDFKDFLAPTFRLKAKG